MVSFFKGQNRNLKDDNLPQNQPKTVIAADKVIIKPFLLTENILLLSDDNLLFSFFFFVYFPQ